MRFSVAVHPLGNSRQPGGRGIETRGRIGMQKKRQTGGGEGRERGLVRSISLSAGRLPPFRDCRLLLRPGGTPVVGGNARRATAALGKRSLADIATPPTSTPPPPPLPIPANSPLDNTHAQQRQNIADYRCGRSWRWVRRKSVVCVRVGAWMREREGKDE